MFFFEVWAQDINRLASLMMENSLVNQNWVFKNFKLIRKFQIKQLISRSVEINVTPC